MIPSFQCAFRRAFSKKTNEWYGPKLKNVRQKSCCIVNSDEAEVYKKIFAKILFFFTTTIISTQIQIWDILEIFIIKLYHLPFVITIDPREGTLPFLIYFHRKPILQMIKKRCPKNSIPFVTISCVVSYAFSNISFVKKLLFERAQGNVEVKSKNEREERERDFVSFSCFFRERLVASP